MAKYKVPGQNLTYDIPDEGSVFRDSRPGVGLDGKVLMRKGGRILTLDSGQYTGDQSKIQDFTVTGEAEKALTNIGGAGNIYQSGMASDFNTATPRMGEIFTQGSNPDNPQGMSLSSNMGFSESSPSLSQTLGSAGANQSQIQAVQNAYTSGNTSTAMSPSGQNVGSIPKMSFNTNPAQTSAIQSQMQGSNPNADVAKAQAMLKQTQAEGEKPFAGSSYDTSAGGMGSLAGTLNAGAGASGGIGGGTSTPGTSSGGTSLGGGGDYLQKLYELVSGNQNPSSSESAYQKQLDALTAQQSGINASRDLGIQAVGEQPIATSFISGQQKAITDRAAVQSGSLGAQAVPLQQQLARAQAQRQAALDASKTALDYGFKREEMNTKNSQYASDLAFKQQTLAQTGENNQADNALAQKKFENDKKEFGLTYALDQQKLSVERQKIAPGTTPLSTTTGKPLTDSERTAAGFAARLVEADTIIDGIGDKFTGASSYLSPFSPNYFKSEDRQKFDQAKRNFVNAVLRRESGAVISDSEFANADKQYFPQPGDTSAVVKQKADNRATSIRNLQLSGGQSSSPASEASAGTTSGGNSYTVRSK